LDWLEVSNADGRTEGRKVPGDGCDGSGGENSALDVEGIAVRTPSALMGTEESQCVLEEDDDKEDTEMDRSRPSDDCATCLGLFGV
jgi:hypothetical protein